MVPVPPHVAARLAAQLLEGRVWLVHATAGRVIDGNTVVLDLDLGWHTWRRDEHVRLAGSDATERKDTARWTEAKAFVERQLPAGTEVLLMSERLEKDGRTLGRIVLPDGQEVGAEVLKARPAKAHAGGRGERGRPPRGPTALTEPQAQLSRMIHAVPTVQPQVGSPRESHSPGPGRSLTSTRAHGPRSSGTPGRAARSARTRPPCRRLPRPAQGQPGTS